MEKARELQKSKNKNKTKHVYFCFTDYAKAFDSMDYNEPRKILQETGIPYYLTCPFRNLYAGQKATFRTRHGTTDHFQLGKGVRQGY